MERSDEDDDSSFCTKDSFKNKERVIIVRTRNSGEYIFKNEGGDG